jgi:iron complex outermembrane recepter protein
MFEGKSPQVGVVSAGRVRTRRLVLPLLSSAAALTGFHAFAQTAPNPQSTAAASSSSTTPESTVDAVIVTAEKRPEQLLNVAAPVTAVSAENLVETNQLRLADFYSTVPGLNLTVAPGGSSVLSMRGLSESLYENPTVATLIDDVPYTLTTAAADGFDVVETDPDELAQIEVLRGPQGVLYGAASLGGIIKYDTIQPSLNGFSGRVSVGVNGIENGNSIGYRGSGAINMPLGADAALRISAFDHSDPGFIDNVLTGQKGVNHGYVSGGRAALLWKPLPALTVNLSALVQDGKTYGSSLVESVNPFSGLPLGPLQQANVANSGWYDRQLQSYAAKIVADLKYVNITSVTGYSNVVNRSQLDYSDIFPPILSPAAVFGFAENIPSTKLSQELRFSGTVFTKLDWMVGGFYTQESTKLTEGPNLYNALTGARVAPISLERAPVDYTEYSVFVNFDYHVTDTFDIQLGDRLSWDNQYFDETLSFGGGAPVTSPAVTSSDKSSTYLIVPRWKITPDVMVYARLASGYRPGGPNVQVQPGSGLPRAFKPDTTQNYEIGTKGQFLDHKLVVDLSIYDIEWKDIQLTNTTVTMPYTVNAESARSQGVELAVELHPASGLTINAVSAWNNAHLTQAFPNSFGITAPKDSPLGYSPPFSGSLSATQQFPIPWWDGATGHAGISFSYVGHRDAEFGSAPYVRPTLPDYTKLDLNAGVRYGTWSVTVYVNNATDQRGVLQEGFNIPGLYQYIQPRTFGASLSKTF